MAAQYADACNLFGGPDEVTPKIDVLRRHCDELGRDITEIEVTAMYREDPAGRHSSTTWSGGRRPLPTSAYRPLSPGPWVTIRAIGLESTFGPAMDRLADVEPAPLQ